MRRAIDLELVRPSSRKSDPHSDHRTPADADPDLGVARENLRDRRARLQHAVSRHCAPEGRGPCTAPFPCAGYEAIDEVLDVVAGADEQLTTALQRALHDRTMMARLAAATRDIAAIEGVGDVIATIPELALLVCPADAAALLHVRGDGPVEVLARCGAPFESPRSRIDEEARAAARGGTPKTPDDHARGKDAEPGARRIGRRAMIPLADGAEGTVLALERAAASACLGEPEIERLAVYASVAGTALARARAGAALRESAARDAATLDAIRDGVIAVDRCGIVRGLNQAAATALGVRREHVLGRRLREVGLSALGLALAGAPSQVMDVVSLPRGDVVLRSQAYDGGVVATIRDVATEHTIAHRMVGSVARFTFDHLLGAAPAFVRVIEEAKRAARCDVPILISGESGTGKEMLAQAIHNASPRASGPFLGINVTAIPRELLESELFGYEGGTFTGARASGRAGKFELAGPGMLLLDEIGDMPIEMQGKLLRVLQERLVQRLGSARDIPVRARIIATSHRDLAEAVNLGRFRLDLFHRLRVLHLHLPPLRERKEDLPLLVENQLRLLAGRGRRLIRIAPKVLAALQAYDWPGNVRELHNVIEGEVSVLPPDEVLLTRIPPVLLLPRPRKRPAACGPPEVLPLAEMERLACESSLVAFGGNVARAARALGVAKGTLYNKMKRYGIGPPEASLASPAAAPRGGTPRD